MGYRDHSLAPRAVRMRIATTKPTGRVGYALAAALTKLDPPLPTMGQQEH
jgi:hypothetical protein